MRPDIGPEAAGTLRQLLAYCRSQEWAGHDPYDALNSRLLALPVLNTRPFRIALTQALKRSPVNLRSILGVPKTQNAKAIALFLSAVLKQPNAAATNDARSLIDRLAALRSPGTLYWCWGYSFPWQTRTVLVPRESPNLVCTTFAANALLDAYERLHEQQLLDMAVSAAGFLVDELFWSSDSAAGFSYPVPSFRSRIHNAHFLGAAFLCRVFALTGDRRWLAPALAAARYSTAQQHHDGSWPYGEEPSHRWIDNFHTGYNLCALDAIARSARTSEFDEALARGFRFYLENFFEDAGAARYYHDRTYPIDIHCVAQSLITLSVLGHLDPRAIPTAHAVFNWAMRHMWDPRGFFYYRVLRSAVIKTSYMRWSQAWMVAALATLLETEARHAVAMKREALAERRVV